MSEVNNRNLNGILPGDAENDLTMRPGNIPNVSPERGHNKLNSIMLPATQMFIDAVLNPFHAKNSARVPDLCSTQTICMRDYTDAISLQNGTALTDVIGYLFYWVYGLNMMTPFSYSGISDDNAGNNYYRVLAIPIRTDGTISQSDAVDVFQGVNSDTIFGVRSDNPEQEYMHYDYAGLVEAFRLFAGGIKILPTIETITSSDTTAIANIWGGQMTPGDLFNVMSNTPITEQKVDERYPSITPMSRMKRERCDAESSYSMASQQISDYRPRPSREKISRLLAKRIGHSYRRRSRHWVRDTANRLGATNHGGQIWELVRNCPDVEEYPNNMGCTVRFNPFQERDQLDYVDILQWDPDGLIEYLVNEMGGVGDAPIFSSQPSHMVTNDVHMPFIAVRFTQSISPAASLPVKLYSTYWMETELVQPTPIYSTKSTCDPRYDEIISVFSNTTRFPTVVSGHTFKSLFKLVDRAISAMVEEEPLLKLAYRDGKKAIGGLIKVHKKHKRKKKKKRTIRKEEKRIHRAERRAKRS